MQVISLINTQFKKIWNSNVKKEYSFRCQTIYMKHNQVYDNNPHIPAQYTKIMFMSFSIAHNCSIKQIKSNIETFNYVKFKTLQHWNNETNNFSIL